MGAALLLLSAMLCRPVRAENGILLEEPNLQVEVISAEITPEGATVLLACRNRSEEEASLLFLTPKADGLDTIFSSGWPSEEISLPAGGEETAELVFLPPEGQDTLSEISLRLSFQGRLSSEGKMNFRESSGWAPASFSEPQEQLVRSEVENPPETDADPVIITDRITEEQAEILDYGQAWICIRRDETLVPFCSIRMRVDRDGSAEAGYSGLAMAFAGDQVFPLESREESGETGTVITTREISLTGESVFYATLILTVSMDEEGVFRVTKQELFSSELGGKYDQAPLGLMDTAEPLLRVLEKTDAPLDTLDIQSVFLSLSEPLTVRLFPASELGEIWIYCEYFFQDGTDVIHPPYQLTKGESD